jgi:hypothetical protein
MAAMSRRADPARIDVAPEAALRNRLIGDGVPEAMADAWIAACDAQAARDGFGRGAAYWTAGWEWIAAQQERRAMPSASSCSSGRPTSYPDRQLRNREAPARRELNRSLSTWRHGA